MIRKLIEHSDGGAYCQSCDTDLYNVFDRCLCSGTKKEDKNELRRKTKEVVDRLVKLKNKRPRK